MSKQKKSKRKVSSADVALEAAKREVKEKEDRVHLYRREDVRRRHDKEDDEDSDEYEAPGDWGHGTEGRRLADGFRMLGASD